MFIISPKLWIEHRLCFPNWGWDICLDRGQEATFNGRIGHVFIILDGSTGLIRLLYIHWYRDERKVSPFPILCRTLSATSAAVRIIDWFGKCSPRADNLIWIESAVTEPEIGGDYTVLLSWSTFKRGWTGGGGSRGRNTRSLVHLNGC